MTPMKRGLLLPDGTGGERESPLVRKMTPMKRGLLHDHSRRLAGPGRVRKMTPMKRGLLLSRSGGPSDQCVGPKDDPDEKGIVTKWVWCRSWWWSKVRKMTPMKRGLLHIEIYRVPLH